ncbi:MAG: hypothetical protein DRP56_03640 [Planctomycetota bacterium]|nr:MAG: hypothetical protein DRP56_03640 [Planctomycetota bacterium]
MNRLWIQLVVLGLAAIGLSGCGDFFAQKPTEIQSREILEELSQIRENPNVQNTLPEVYSQPTSRLAIKGGVKVFYFTKHHPANDLAALLHQQLGVVSTTNPAANQIVAFCKDDAQADVVQQYLEMTDISPVQVNIDCLIIERFGDITMDWETSVLVQNLLGEEITLGEQLGTFFDSKDPLSDVVHGIKNGESVIFSAARDFPLISDSIWSSMERGALLDLAPAFPGAALRETERGAFGMDFGYWDNMGVPDHQVRTIIDLLVSRGYLKILLNPKLETINGKKASVTIKDFVPIEEVKTGTAGASGVYNITKYVWVSDTLTVTPHVYADGSVGLQTEILIGSRSKPEGVVQRSIITERSIRVDENRVETGKSLIIGGMRKSEKRSVIRGVPFLKDIPLLGILFSSKDFEEKGTEIIFILTPSISSGGRGNEQMVEELRDKYKEPQYEQDLTDIIMDPLGQSPSAQVLEKEATEAEIGRVEAELALELAQMQSQTETKRADRAESRAEQLRQQAQQLRQQAQKAKEEAQKIATETKTTMAQIRAAQQQAAELEAAKQKAAAEAQQAQAEAHAAQQKAVEAAQKVQQAQEQAQQAQKQLNNTQQKPIEENKEPMP